MIINDIIREYYDPEDDHYTNIKIDHQRRPRITLRHLQKLRKTRALEELEDAERIENASSIYARGSDSGPEF